MKSVRLSCGVIALGLLSACGDWDPCARSVIRTVPSPSGQWQAVVFTVDCGATTDFNTHLSVLKADAALPPTDGGNAFIYDRQLPLQLSWTSDTELRVAGTQGIKAIKRKPRVERIEIRYVD